MAAEKLHRTVAKAVESRFGWLVHAMAPATKKYKKCSGGISGIIKATAKVTKCLGAHLTGRILVSFQHVFRELRHICPDVSSNSADPTPHSAVSVRQSIDRCTVIQYNSKAGKEEESRPAPKPL